MAIKPISVRSVLSGGCWRACRLLHPGARCGRFAGVGRAPLTLGDRVGMLRGEVDSKRSWPEVQATPTDETWSSWWMLVLVGRECRAKAGGGRLT